MGMIQDETYKFNIYGRYTRFPYFLFVMVSCAFILLVYASVRKWTIVDFYVIGTIVLCIALIIGGSYAGYFLLMLKTLQIDTYGVRYIFNKKIKIDLLWKEVKKVETHASDNKAFYLLIKGTKRIINFNNTEIGASKEDLQKAFYELLKYQPQYHFEIEDEIGWSNK